MFERSSKRVELTQAGATLYGYATEILELHKVAERAVSDLVELVTGNLTIGASFTVGEYVLPRLLAAFTQRYPEVKFSVMIGNTEMVHEHARDTSIDIGLVEGLVEDSQLKVTKFLDDELILFVSKNHPLAETTSISPEEIALKLKSVPFIFREEGSGTRLAVEKALQKLDFKPEHIITLGSTQAIKEAVEANLGVSMLSKWTLRKELKLGSIKPIRCCNPITRGFYLLQHKEKFQSRATAEFVKLVLQNDLTAILTKF
ncbi:DNA-binding transcriptional LysR family regulator [Desulfallas thermosapovorans DSM 6562]|uniref:DNA-binding transcriptional LysR family regulator n=1 Tax=Desulfallas thermosapovorans DSM 6562 TaxID=1121431 RepID=A0A5S4ZNY3_9FIRM|nr:LysR substrate-binding domain-containing protein [Desulfallas thermosapovorans]TYO94546.1 DNA-binding transcriptional LysR family regulator [Desulfallas thermosapovorans DSM 6562]